LKSRVLSGLLAALFLSSTVTTAFAANDASLPTDDTPPAYGIPSSENNTPLIFIAQLPAEYNADEMSAATMEQVTEILHSRLAFYGLEDVASVVVSSKNVTVALTRDADQEAVITAVTKPGVLQIQDGDGAVWLSNEAVNAVESKTNEDNTYYLDLHLTDAAKTKLTEAYTALKDKPNRDLTALLDGKQIGTFSLKEEISDSYSLLGSLSQDESREAAGLLNMGALPVTLKQSDGTETPSDNTTTDAEQTTANNSITEGTEQPAPAPEPPISDDIAAKDPEQPTPDDSTAETPAQPDAPSDIAPAPDPDPEDQETPIFSDIQGHWAEDAMQEAVSRGLLNGVDGKLLPDAAVKSAEIVTILNRALGATITDDISDMKNVPVDAWYRNDVAKAVYLGIVKKTDTRDFNVGANRAQTFEMLSRAFAFETTNGGEALAGFTDIGSMTEAQKNAASVLVQQKIVNGTSPGKLSPEGIVTRAQFMTMLLRMIPQEAKTEAEINTLTDNALISSPSAELTGVVQGNRIFNANTRKVSLADVQTNGRIILKGAETLEVTGTGSGTIDQLAVDQAGAANITLPEGIKANRLLIAGAGRGGTVTFSGQTDDIEITASNRRIILSDMDSTNLTVTGSGNVIVLNGNVKNIRTSIDATHTTITTAGKDTETVVVEGRSATIGGSGHAKSIDVRAGNCNVTLESDKKTENIPSALQDMNIVVGVPTKITPQTDVLITQFKFTDVKKPFTCKLEWYQDGKLLKDDAIENYQIQEGGYVRHNTTFTFERNMPKSIKMGIKLTWWNPSTGKEENRISEKEIPIENYSDEWYVMRDGAEVLKRVSSVYNGDYSTAYARDNDYSANDKELWINAKGYSSDTEYLCWINRAYQHVNVFQGSRMNWKLVKSFIVGTGASGTPTPVGETVVSYKDRWGWTTGTYTVRPVVGFYPGTGYAFHSRLCYPGTETEFDYSSGYPVSHGCVRMLRDDINWIYNNIPVGTKVVIF